VARRAMAHGVPTIILAGSVGPGYQQLYQHGIAGIVCITDRPMTFERSIGRTAELLEGAAERTVRLLMAGVHLPNPK
jgi:glycerate 2-kinase